jgi:hypothetical protein
MTLNDTSKDLMVSLSNHEVERVEATASPTSWFDKLTMRFQAVFAAPKEQKCPS